MLSVAFRTHLSRAAALLGVVGLVACGTPTSVGPGPGPATAPKATDASAGPASSSAESAGVAARFPEPTVSLRTPAFQLGRTTYTQSAEVQSVMQGLARGHGAVVRVIKLGESSQGVPYEALLFSRSAQATPDALKSGGRATVLLHGPQSAQSPAGTEALLVVAQELAQGRLQRLLDRVNVIVWTRAAVEAGVAGDRDHLRLSTPQAQALARLVREYQPVVVAEVAEYAPSAHFALRFGAVERHDAMVQYASTANLAPFITKAAEEWFRQPVVAGLKRQGLSAEWHYAISSEAVERKLTMGIPRPDNSRNVQGLKNSVSLMIESRADPTGGRAHLKRRVHTLVTGLEGVLNSAAERGADLLKLRQYVDAETSSQACKGNVVVEAALSPGEYTLQALDADTGSEKSFTASWDSALALRELRVRPRPCGYWLAADQADVVGRLRLLGVRVEQVLAKGVVQGDNFVESNGTAGRELKPVAALLDLPPGSYYVPLSQPLANLAVAALEPDTDFSYAAAGLIKGVGKLARVTAWPGVKMTVLP